MQASVVTDRYAASERRLFCYKKIYSNIIWYAES